MLFIFTAWTQFSYTFIIENRKAFLPFDLFHRKKCQFPCETPIGKHVNH